MRLKKTVSSVTALVLAVAPLTASRQTPTPERRDAKLFQIKLTKDQQIMHALDRLTFGPRPGDVEQVKKIGLKKWVDLQLNPERIPETPFLQARLMPLESLWMSSADVARHYPQPGMIKAIADGRKPMPDDPVLRASVQKLVVRYRAKKDPNGEKSDRLDDLQPVKPLEQILAPDQIRILKTGTQAQKKQLLRSIPATQVDDLVLAMPGPLRQQILPLAATDIRRKIMMLQAPQQVVMFDLLEAKMLRAVYSNRQLAEELDDFWFNHFNIYHDKGADRFLIPSFEREAIQPHVLGRFRDLLEATAKSPAMLFYLDNFESVRPDLDAKAPQNKVKRGLNENYARELMELHTLGVNGGYTQKDVIEVARCFTGWGIQAPQKGGDFFFNDKVHDKGEKVVLGHVIPAGGGIEDGDKVLDILASNPATAKFISRELAQRFVSDTPPQPLVDRMAQTFLTKHGDIREVMRIMLASKEFWSEGAYRAKVKTPFDMVVSAVRALDANIDNAFGLANQVGNLGEPLYRKQEPTGYSNMNAEWVSSSALLARMNFALSLAQNKIPGVTVDTARFGQDGAAEIAQSLLLRDVSPQTRATIENALKEQQAKTPGPVPALVAGLVLGSPDFQKR
jgi:uncharacterized protein (DUF1800 family)